MTKHNWEEVYTEAQRLALEHGSWRKLAKAMKISRSTLCDGLKREKGIEHFNELLPTDSIKGQKCLQQLAYYKRQAQRYEQELSKREWFLDTINEVVAVLPAATVPVLEANATGTRQEAVLLIGDNHWGQVTPQEHVGIFPHYNIEIARKRLIHTFERAIAITRTHAPHAFIGKLHIFMMGDHPDGSHLRNQHGKFTDGNLVTQSIDFANQMAECVRFAAQYYPQVEIACVPGNHSRILPKKADNEPTETLDYYIAHHIKALLSNQVNVSLDIPSTWYTTKSVLGWKIFATHGEDIRSWAGLPWYGVKRFINDYQAMMHMVSRSRIKATQSKTTEELLDMLYMFDYVFLGHFHQSLSWENVDTEVVVNGTTAGVSIYGVKGIRKLSRPSQTFMLMHEKYGITARYLIYLDEVL